MNADIRQLHPDEKAAIHKGANGDSVEEKKLTQAACYAVQCNAMQCNAMQCNAMLGAVFAEQRRLGGKLCKSQQAALLGPEMQWVLSQNGSAGLFCLHATAAVAGWC
ncbi:hypothetical protein GCM10027093_33710 [Paraburkholderia jirisanensis]